MKSVVITLRTLSLVFAVVLVVACEKVSTPTRTNHYVSVTREISENAGEEIWTMSVGGSDIYFYHYSYLSYLSSEHRLYNLVFRSTDGKNALSVFNTFSQWAATARANQVEPFSKRISSDCFLSSSSGGKLNEDACEFSYRYSEGRLNDRFTEKDIAKFSELLKQLPEANAERLAKESKGDQEQSLFKDKAKADEAVETLPTPPAPPPAEMITLTQPVPIQTESGTVTLPVGTKLQFVSQINTKVHVYYLNRDYTIQIAATDLNRQRSKTAK
jgi:hypothetical protein